SSQSKLYYIIVHLCFPFNVCIPLELVCSGSLHYSDCVSVTVVMCLDLSRMFWNILPKCVGASTLETDKKNCADKPKRNLAKNHEVNNIMTVEIKCQ
ncbi:hypothetical protein L9F63_017072, partial [Diploptera punctata]